MAYIAPTNLTFSHNAYQDKKVRFIPVPDNFDGSGVDDYKVTNDGFISKVEAQSGETTDGYTRVGAEGFGTNGINYSKFTGAKATTVDSITVPNPFGVTSGTTGAKAYVELGKTGVDCTLGQTVNKSSSDTITFVKTTDSSISCSNGTVTEALKIDSSEIKYKGNISSWSDITKSPIKETNRFKTVDDKTYLEVRGNATTKNDQTTFGHYFKIGNNLFLLMGETDNVSQVVCHFNVYSVENTDKIYLEVSKVVDVSGKITTQIGKINVKLNVDGTNDVAHTLLHLAQANIGGSFSTSNLSNGSLDGNFKGEVKSLTPINGMDNDIRFVMFNNVFEYAIIKNNYLYVKFKDNAVSIIDSSSSKGTHTAIKTTSNDITTLSSISPDTGNTEFTIGTISAKNGQSL